MSTDRPRFSVTVTQEMYDEINKYQHEHKLSTQTKAIAQILQIGIDALYESINSTVSNDSAKVQNDEQVSPPTIQPVHPLLTIYENLNKEGQEKLMSYAKDLSELSKYKKCAELSEADGVG